MLEQPPQMDLQARMSAHRVSLFTTIARFCVVLLILLTLAYLVGWALIPGFPILPLFIINSVSIAVVLVALSWQKSRPQWGIATFVVSLNLLVLAAVPLLGGLTSPLVMALPVMVLLAGMLWERTGMRVTVALLAVGLTVQLIVQLSGWLVPYPLPSGIFEYVIYLVVVGGAIIMSVVILQQFFNLNQQVLDVAQQRGVELATALEEVRVAARTEREARRDQDVAALRRELLVRRYVDFLQQVARGDYQAQLDLGALSIDTDVADELLILGRYLNETVGALVAALNDLQIVQQRYLAQAWSTFLQSETLQPAYRLRDMRLEAAPDARVGDAVGELVASITVRNQAIGVLGVRRESATPWSAAERELVEAIAYQLGQTLDNLRLVEQTQRGALRERLVADVTDVMRQSLDIDQVLQAALRAMGEAFELDAVEVRLGQTPTLVAEEVHA